jgi:hypothetical protein
MAGGLVVMLAALLASPVVAEADALPRRVRRIVLHVLGNPAYEAPARRWVFLTPRETQRLWARRFGAHWIVWTDGSIWARHAPAGAGASFWPPAGRADRALRGRLAQEAAPIYSHLHLGNSRSIGIEVAHSGRADDPFPEAQTRSVAWLVRTLLEMSRGRLGPADVYGHKDLDRRPAYVSSRCVRAGCPVFSDAEGRPYRRRVDPPEGLFNALAGQGLAVPRTGREDDRELRRAESLGAQEARVGAWIR